MTQKDTETMNAIIRQVELAIKDACNSGCHLSVIAFDCSWFLKEAHWKLDPKYVTLKQRENKLLAIMDKQP